MPNFRRVRIGAAEAHQGQMPGRIGDCGPVPDAWDPGPRGRGDGFPRAGGGPPQSPLRGTSRDCCRFPGLASARGSARLSRSSGRDGHESRRLGAGSRPEGKGDGTLARLLPQGFGLIRRLFHCPFFLDWIGCAVLPCLSFSRPAWSGQAEPPDIPDFASGKKGWTPEKTQPKLQGGRAMPGLEELRLRGGALPAGICRKRRSL